jgi:hypothetical protein
MNTPTDDEIVAGMTATYSPDDEPIGSGIPEPLRLPVTVIQNVEGWWLVRFSDDSEAIVRPSRLAREGLPVKDEVETLWWMAFSAYIDYCREDDAARAAIATIRTFLANRDAERDAEVAELVESAKLLKGLWPSHSSLYGLTDALAKLERKP